MKSDVLPVDVKGVLPTNNGCAVFLGDEGKTFVIYVDQSIGNVITMAVNGDKRERPLTHDLIVNLFRGFEVDLQRVVVNDVDEGTFFARIILKMENELGTKLVEVDARPSDSIVLAILEKKPIYVDKEVYERVEDMTEVLEKILKQDN